MSVHRKLYKPTTLFFRSTSQSQMPLHCKPSQSATLLLHSTSQLQMSPHSRPYQTSPVSHCKSHSKSTLLRSLPSLPPSLWLFGMPCILLGTGLASSVVQWACCICGAHSKVVHLKFRNRRANEAKWHVFRDFRSTS